MVELGRIIGGYVWVVGVKCSVVLVIDFGVVEGLQRDDFGHDGMREDVGFFQLIDIRLRNALLFFIGVKNHRAILSANIWTLTIELCGVVSHREKYF